MMYVHILNRKDGAFELIDGDFLQLYPEIAPADLVALSDEQYADFCVKDNGRTKFLNGQFVYEQTAIDEVARLEMLRENIRAQINAKRDKCVNGGVYVEAIDKWVDSDDVGRSTLVEIKADFDLNGRDNTYTLICADNTAKTINFEDFKAVWDAVKNLKEKMFENAYMHKLLLDYAEDPESYDWGVGWVKTYEEHLAGAQNG